MNKYLKEASEINDKKFLPKTFQDYCNLHPSQTRQVPMSHIKKLREEFTGKLKTTQIVPGRESTGFTKNKMTWD